VVEDALKFVRREVRRGSMYNGIILDPPAYGRGPDGEKWILEENLNELIQLCAMILLPSKSFLLVNLYSMGFSALVLENLVNSYFPAKIEKESGEIFLADKYEKRLPLGTFLRFRNN
jgi:23S rRNA (cytosine1962-C5)-methyltransferase